MSFPDGALRERHLSDITVTGSYFHATSLAGTVLRDCRFVGCNFERLELDGSEEVSGSSLDDECRIGSVVRLEGGEQVARFGWEEIGHEHRRAGFTSGLAEATETEFTEPDPDDDLRLVQRFLRGFLRSSALNESTVRQRLGAHASRFFRSLLPRLVQAGVVREAQYRGHGGQRRMKLAVPMIRIEQAMSEAGGEFDRFVRALQRA